MAFENNNYTKNISLTNDTIKIKPLIKIKIEQNKSDKNEMDERIDATNYQRRYKEKPIRLERRQTSVGPCNCSKKCYSLLTELERKDIFNNFWKLETRQLQSSYLRKCLQKRNSMKKKKVDYLVFVQDKSIKICRRAFLNIHNLDRYYVDKILLNEKNKMNFNDEKVIDFVRQSCEFKSCVYPNISDCYKKYKKKYEEEEVETTTKLISFKKFRLIFTNQLKMKLNKICRVCLNYFNQFELIDIFSKFDNRQIISDSIMDLASIQILKDERHLPQLICKNCVNQLISSLDFRQLCRNSDQILRFHPTKPPTIIEQNFQDENIKMERDDDDIGNGFEFNQFLNQTNVDDFVHMKEKQNTKYIEINKDGVFRIKKHAEYDHQKNKLVKSHNKVQGPPCTCPRRCYSLISKEERHKVFERFWKIKKVNKQNCYLHDCLQAVHVKQRTVKSVGDDNSMNEFKRRLTIIYKVPINDGKQWAKVCQVAFCNLHSVTKKRLTTIIAIKKKHMPQKRIKAKQNDENFKDEENIKDEYLSSDNSDDEQMEVKHKCQICENQFNCYRTLSYHKRQHNHYTIDERAKKIKAEKFKPNESGHFVCPDCGALYQDKKKMMYHRRKYHGRVNYTCDNCGEVFQQYRQFHYHKYKHKDTNNGSVSCDICGKIYFSSQVLQSHQNKHQKAISCHICGEFYTSFNCLKKHRETIHEKEQRTKNDKEILDNFGSYQQNLSCSICSIVFEQASLLNQHIMLMHYDSSLLKLN